MIVQCALLKCYTILGYSTETVLLIFPFLQTNITVRMRSSGGQGGVFVELGYCKFMDVHMWEEQSVVVSCWVIVGVQLAFIQCRSDDKTAILLHLLRNVVKPTEQTVIFVSTKHHVEFLNMVRLTAADYCLFSSLFIVLCICLMWMSCRRRWPTVLMSFCGRNQAIIIS